MPDTFGMDLSSIDHVLTTTRAVRKRLDFERPVPRELLEECLEIGLQAPTGGNRQDWQFVFVTDPQKKAALGDLYRRAWEPYRAQPKPSYQEGDPRAQQFARVVSSAQYLADRMHEVPVMLIPCMKGRPPDGAPAVSWAGTMGSVLPAAWSFMLAARSRGLGTAWTTLHLVHEREAAEVLGIPYDRVVQCALITIGYYRGEDFRPAERVALDRVTHWETW